MRKLSLFGIITMVMLAAIAASVSSSHSAFKAAPAQIDPFSLMANARNLPRTYLKIVGRLRSAINVE